MASRPGRRRLIPTLSARSSASADGGRSRWRTGRLRETIRCFSIRACGQHRDADGDARGACPRAAGFAHFTGLSLATRVRAGTHPGGRELEETRKKSRLRPRRIIERPRLTRLLDSTTARVRMLIAPAGYGKTTLAEQWTSAGGRKAVWYQCRRASADVAHLAVGLAEAASALLPGCDIRLRERLLATKDPAVEVEVLAEILAEDLREWPADAWLVIDDYHLIRSESDAERFVDAVIRESTIQVLVTTRSRPAWSSSRLALAGEVFSIGQDALAMSTSEAGDVLRDQVSASMTSLLTLASGWPAVIGLACVTETAVWPDGAAGEGLYQYFAEEVVRSLDARVREDLERLLVAPRLDRALAHALIGSARAELVLRIGVEVGILDLRETQFDFHPLARAFLENRDALGTRERRRLTRICLEAYRDLEDWDSAFEIAERHGSVSDLEQTIVDALDELLESGRLATIETWTRRALTSGNASPPFQIAAAELACRRGELSVAETMVQGALKQLNDHSPLLFRALRLAGQIAHLDGRELDGLDRYLRAEAVAKTPDLKREARWGRCMTLAALEDEAAVDLLHLLVKELPPDDPREQVRAADKQISMALRFGAPPDLAKARQAEQLLTIVGDPSVRCSFRTVYSSALVLAAQYEDGLRVASDLIDDSTTSHCFGLTYGRATTALALGGLRRFPEAHQMLDAAFASARSGGDLYGQQNVYAIRVRLLVQERRAAEACLLEPPEISNALPGMRGEIMASRGLALACVGRGSDALQLADSALANSKSLETVVLSAGIRAIVDVRARGEEAFGSADALLTEAESRGGIDLLVACYRAAPDILIMLLANPRTRDRALFYVGRAGDQDFVSALGVAVHDALDPVQALSPRERDVYALLCEGLSDKEIARQLFIAPGTTKTHTHSILEKTGYKTRRALMLDAARRRLDQAAPTTSREGDGSPGS